MLLTMATISAPSLGDTRPRPRNEALGGTSDLFKVRLREVFMEGFPAKVFDGDLQVGQTQARGRAQGRRLGRGVSARTVPAVGESESMIDGR